ncbi:MAG TPA: hypothetical protein VLA72_01705 [Anaerolineales bacterium]|nr:hypothetical protein [Anaerolineales bacterium]
MNAIETGLFKLGGGSIGSDWLDGIDEVQQSQEKLKSEPWTISGFVFGWNGAGNPLVLENNGAIITEDHNFGGTRNVANSFDELLAMNVRS